MDSQDTTPDAFTLSALVGVPLNSDQVSNEFPVKGINAPAPISVSQGADYRINGGAWTTVPGAVPLDQRVQVRLKSSSQHGARVSATLNIGGVTARFDVTTLQPPALEPFLTPLVINNGTPTVDVETATLSLSGAVDIDTDSHVVTHRLVRSYHQDSPPLDPFPALSDIRWSAYNPQQQAIFSHTLDTRLYGGWKLGVYIVEVFARTAEGTVCPPVKSSINAQHTGPYLDISTTDNRPSGEPPFGYPTPKPDIMLTAVTGRATIMIKFGNFTEMVGLPIVTFDTLSGGHEGFVEVANLTPSQIELKAGNLTNMEKLINISIKANVIDPRTNSPKTIQRGLSLWYDVPTWGYGW